MFYDIRRRQPSGDAASQLDNQLAAQLLMAIWIGEPWNAVRKVKLFDQEYHRIFRKASADRLFLAALIDDAIEARKTQFAPRTSDELRLGAVRTCSPPGGLPPTR